MESANGVRRRSVPARSPGGSSHSRPGRIAVASIILSMIAGCSSVPPETTLRPPQSEFLFRAETAISDEWQHLELNKSTEYGIGILDGKVGIRAVGRGSASGLIRRVGIDPFKCPSVEWSWAVKSLQESADLRVKEGEDVAASIFFLFGDPGFLFDPKPVPTLRYVWTNASEMIGVVIDNPYIPGTVRSVVVRSGTGRLGQWTAEARDLLSDYRQAFGAEPSGHVHAIILFTDNDQTNEPVEAYYGWAKANCNAAP